MFASTRRLIIIRRAWCRSSKRWRRASTSTRWWPCGALPSRCFTGAEPVVIFPDADPSKGCASGKFFTSGEKPVEFWQKPAELWAQLEARLATIAGVAVAVNPHTAILMFNPDTEDGGKLAYITSQVQPERLAGLMNLIVAAGSAWVAGRDDCEVLSLLVQSAEHARSQGRRASLA